MYEANQSMANHECFQYFISQQYCEFSPESDKCKEWLRSNFPEVYDDINKG
jgi:hypothetical protein